MVTIRRNERSWAIEIISQINKIADDNELRIKRAGGETTISVNRTKRMFPDVILYGDNEETSILQGWELKMPDVPITDDAFVNDAQRKARTLHLESCVIWNFTYAKFFVLNKDTDCFETKMQWENLQIVSREDVACYQKAWENTLRDVVLTVNEYFSTHQLRRATFDTVIAESAIDMLINYNKANVADHLRRAALQNVLIEAELEQWWKDIKAEYQFDETDKYWAYAKTLIINWAYRILFAHLIKRHQNAAMVIDTLDYDTTPQIANGLFETITSKADFYNIFEGVKFAEYLPEKTWQSLVELSLFMRDNGVRNINQAMVQRILERTIRQARRELNGQYTTPRILARILVRMTVHNWMDNCLDPCCGTGTIPHELIEIKKGAMGASKAVETTWASDKYKLPLQIANISMTAFDTINLANRLFQKNALAIKVGDSENIVNPQDGNKMNIVIPSFGAICSNLPFVAFESLQDVDKALGIEELDSKSDLSYHIALHLSDLLKPEGYLGIIISNAWLGTSSGDIFYHELQKRFHIRQVHISGRGRWFQNAQVVATLLILQKKVKDALNELTSFFVWKQSLETLAQNSQMEDDIVNCSLLDRVLDDTLVKRSSYSTDEIKVLKELGISYNALFHDIRWLLAISEKFCPIGQIFKTIRGGRRGWDALFFPTGDPDIEAEFLEPALFNARSINGLIAMPDRKGFCCSESIDFLKRERPKAYRWIKKFETEKNGKGKPLPEVLKRKNMEWYEMKPKEVAEIFTMMNPDDRLFFGRFRRTTFINQRLIGFQFKKETTDKMLCHALMNSILQKFFIEAAGFGRGLGVLDLNKDNIGACYMLNPNLISEEDVKDIKSEFRKILKKNIMAIDEELEDTDWRTFNLTVLKAYGIESYYLCICNSLKSLRRVRKTAKEAASSHLHPIETGTGEERDESKDYWNVAESNR